DAAGDRGPLLVAQCWSADVLSAIKLSVDVDRLPPGVPAPTATVLHHLGLADERIETVDWDDLDRTVAPDHLTSVWIPSFAVPVAGDLVALDQLVRRLRQDCPWDREQTHASLTRHLLEESYEVIDAIDELTRAEAADDGVADAVDHLEEELGDLLFQVYFHSCLAAEAGRFTLADVAGGVHDKLVARHPHVFGDVVADDAGTVVGNWEQIKQAEKGRDSVTDGIPAALPALALAAKLARKAETVPGVERPGFDAERARAEAILGRLADPGPGPRADAPAGVADEVGELLLAVTNASRLLGVDAEDALRGAANRLRQRIREVEHETRGAG
ncbi:MAG TPA: MazG family protein, partial [Acidimicrobiales bacterium]|nr:MazG family protein [Acidimicrobiales bacterium]